MGFCMRLYQEVLYERVTAGRRVRLHRRIGEREEQAYGEQAREIAAELAVHFEQGRDYRRAVQYLQQAGENALRRLPIRKRSLISPKGWSCSSSAGHARAHPARTDAANHPGVPLSATKGYAAPEVEKAYTRARELCQQVGETPQLFPVLWGLWSILS